MDTKVDFMLVNFILILFTSKYTLSLLSQTNAAFYSNP